MFSEDSNNPIAMDADSLGEELPPRNGRGRGRGFRGSNWNINSSHLIIENITRLYCVEEVQDAAETGHVL